MEIGTKPVETAEDIQRMCAIAEKVWHLTYDPLLPPGQVEYMLDQFQSPHAVRDQMERQNYRYYFLTVDGTEAGFVGFAPRYEGKEETYLSKVYLLPEFRGTGAVKAAFGLVEEETRRAGLSKIRLTVNKENTHAAAVYQHYGFQVVEKVKADIGSGYYMDDFVMVKEV